jgi:glycosyltransferase involved in cell wall biosynthesis
MAKVSVIVPVLETQWLLQCLESISGNGYQDLELIVENDKGMTGAAATRNRGLKRAAGEYVIFCDADDYMEPGAIQKLVDAIDDVDMVLGSFRKFGEFESKVWHPTKEMGMKELANYVMRNLREPKTHQMLSGCWAKLYRRSKISSFPEELVTAEDMAFNFDYLTRCSKVKFISDIVYHNRKRPDSLSTTFDEKNPLGLFGFLGGLKCVKMFLKQFYMESEIEDALDSSKVYHSMLYFTRIHGGGRETFKRIYP